MLVDDEPDILEFVGYNLTREGFEVSTASNGVQAIERAKEFLPHLVLLDVMMPVKDGFTLAQDIRAVNAEIPIIFLTAKTLNEDILEGFKIGADDYITKPFSMEVLVSRIEAILRRVCGKKNKENTQYKIGRFQFDTQKQLLTIDDQHTKLTTKESELLSLLCAHTNEILQRDFVKYRCQGLSHLGITE